MRKKIDNLRRLIEDLKLRYGPDDEHVQRLHSEVEMLGTIKQAKGQEHRTSPQHKHYFQSLAKQQYYEMKTGDSHNLS